jgi:prepilin-type N-terminal cleavage/methylation domain-containing protein
MSRHMTIKSRMQKGYGLIEMIVGLALAGILTTGFTTFAVQTITESTRAHNHMQAMMQVENAGYRVTCDIQMADNLTLGENAGFPMQLVWLDQDQNLYQVTVNMSGGRIERTLVENDGSPVQTLIAQSINESPSLTGISYADGMVTFNVTSTYGNTDESRSYQIKKRLDVQ